MAGYAKIALVLALLAATAGAFALTESLKLEKSPITGTKVAKTFSPVCNCPTRTARIAFRLRTANRLTVAIVDSDGKVVRTLVRGRSVPRGLAVLHWNGRDDAGQLLPDGSYKPRVHLSSDRRTILLPNPILLDTHPPRAAILSVVPQVFTPGHGRVTVTYRVSEPAGVILYVNGVRRVRSRFHPTRGKIQWYGTVGSVQLPAGGYRLRLAGIDLAGNLGPRTAPRSVRIRYIEPSTPLVRVRAGGPVVVHYLPALPVRWVLDGRSGFAQRGVVRLRAPGQPGRYGLFLSRDSHGARVTVVVGP
ncbi:MAG TPA: FlgD immunoglobulin-like domain containing protein [Gaiellaceae bacterium]|nr:FlgD immunoglobulin-like domain containing protein [Gaiellaceae bacterium]